MANKKSDKRLRGRKMKKTKVYSYDEKLEILRYWYENKMDIEQTMNRWKVGRSTLFKWKRTLWDDMKDMDNTGIKNAEDAQQKKESTIAPVVDNKKKSGVVRKATTATEQILDLILFKLEREVDFMKDNPEDFGNIKIHELSKLLDVTASYIIPKATGEDKEGLASTSEKYSRITQYIQNNFLNKEKKEYGSKKDSTQRHERLVTVIPGSRDEGDGDGHSKSEVQE